MTRLIAEVTILFNGMRVACWFRAVCRGRVHLPSVLFTVFAMLREC
jgi:hypothetical protein